MRTLLAVVGAWIAAAVVVMLLQGGLVLVVPDAFDLAAGQPPISPWALIALLVADILGAVVAGYIAAWLGREKRRTAVWITALLLFVGRIVMLFVDGPYQGTLAGVLSAIIIPLAVLLGARLRVRAQPVTPDSAATPHAEMQPHEEPPLEEQGGESQRES